MDRQATFKTDGYEVVRGVVNKETIEAVGAFLRSEMNVSLDMLRKAIPFASVPELIKKVDSDYAGERFETLSPEIRMIISGHFALETRLSSRLWDIPRDPGVRRLLERVLEQTSLCMHMPPAARFVLPGNRYAGVPAHQDVTYNRHMTRFVTMWVPFVEIDERCGGVAVFSGSGFDPEIEVKKQQFWLEGVPTKNYHRAELHLKPGDVLLLNPWVIHESVSNTSDRTRISIDFRFLGAADESTKHRLDMQSWTVSAPQTRA